MLVGHCWSLCVEERFYVFWPLLLTLWPCGTHARRALIAAMIVTWYTALRAQPIPDMTIALWAMPFPLLMGCALAIFLPRLQTGRPKYATLPLAVLMFWLYAAYAGPQEFTSATIGTFFLQGRRVFPAAMVACAVCTAGAPRNLVTRFLQECGKLSYARPICSIDLRLHRHQVIDTV